MSIEEILKLDSKLGEYYCLLPLPKDGWTLGRTGTSREIMNSEKNTKEQLLKFIKEHKKYNITKVIRITCLIINIVWLLVIFANFFIKSKVLMCMSWGVLVTLLPILAVLDMTYNNNKKIANKVLDEDIKYLKKLHSERIVKSIKKQQETEENAFINEDNTISRIKKVSKKYTVKGKNMALGKGDVKNTTVTKAKVENSTLTTSKKTRTKGEDKKEI